MIEHTMSYIEACEAKAHFLELLERVRRGERVYITRRGIPVAVLAPMEVVQTRPVAEVITALKEFRRRRSLGMPVKALVQEGRI